MEKEQKPTEQIEPKKNLLDDDYELDVNDEDAVMAYVIEVIREYRAEKVLEDAQKAAENSV